MTTKVQTRRIELDGELLEGGAVTYHSDGPFTTEEIPVVNDNKITITQWGVVKWFFNLNQDNDKTIVLESQAAWGWGDMLYSDFNYIEQSGSSIELALCTKVNVTGDFTINAPSDLKEWQAYYLRVINPDWEGPYTMSLGSNVTNPMLVDLTLSEGFIDIFVFMAVDWVLELQEWVKRLARVAYSGAFEDLSAPFKFIKATYYNPTTLKVDEDLETILNMYNNWVLPILWSITDWWYAYPYTVENDEFVWYRLALDEDNWYIDRCIYVHSDDSHSYWYKINQSITKARINYNEVDWLSTVAHTWNFVDIIGKPVLVTKAEWEALPDTKLTDWTFYIIYKE